MSPLPDKRYELGQWRQHTVELDYHVPADGHFYSVPYRFVGKRVDIRLSVNAIEIFHRAVRIASHERSHVPGKHTTLHEHRPKSHRQHVEQTPERLLAWAATVGTNTRALCGAILRAKPHPEAGFRCCVGIKRLAEQHGADRVEAAAAHALHLGAYTLAFLESLLDRHLEGQPLSGSESSASRPTPAHGNIRGAAYFQSLQ